MKSDFFKNCTAQESWQEMVRFHVDLGLDYLECFLNSIDENDRCVGPNKDCHSKPIITWKALANVTNVLKSQDNEPVQMVELIEIGAHADSTISSKRSSIAEIAMPGNSTSFDVDTASNDKMNGNSTIIGKVVEPERNAAFSYGSAENKTVSGINCSSIDINSNYVEQLMACKNLPDLAKFAALFPFANANKKIIFGNGAEDADVMLIGDIPSIEDEICGKPFVDAAGMLLQTIMKAINVTKIYTTNLLLHRCPEIKFGQCQEVGDMVMYKAILDRHISIVRPMALLLMGSITASTMLGLNKIADAQGKEYTLYNPYLQSAIPAFVIHHPELMMRFPIYKKATWHTVQMLKNNLDRSSVHVKLLK